MSGEPHACPSPDRFLALLEDSVAEPDRSRDLDHIRDCPRCSAAFSRMADSWSLSDLACADTAVGRDTLAFERRLRALRAEPRPLADDVCEETPAIPGYDGITLHSWGGMATIYRARDTAIDRPVAIKLLSSHAIHGKAGRHRALREARLLARLAHPGVVAIHATGIWRDRPYLVLEWIDGRTLQDRIDEGVLDPPRAAAIALELAKTLVDLHGAGIIHRDLKPDNVLLAAPAAAGLGETVKLIDFGLARPDDASRELTVADTILGTPSYMAAEQTGLDPSLGETGPATDLHGIGSLLFAMLTGHAPYEAASVMASLQRAVRGGVAGWERLDGVPGELRAIVKRCLRADPRQRYSSAAELAAHLSAFLDTGRPACRRSARNALLHRPKRGWRWTAAAMLPLALAAGTVRLAGWTPLRRPDGADRRIRTSFKPVVTSQDADANPAPVPLPDRIENRLFEEINRLRLLAGLPPLGLDERLTRSARAHAANMLRHDRVAHLFEGESFGNDRIGASGYRCAFAHQEVFCEPAESAGERTRALDPGTRAELLNARLRDAGVGVVVDRSGRAWEVLLLAVPVGS